MNYLDQIEKELRQILDSDESESEKWADTIVKFVRDKILESYKNGLAAAKTSKPPYARHNQNYKKSQRQK